MNSTPPQSREIELAHSDWALIGLSTRYARRTRQADTDSKLRWRVVLFDGSGLAPSWRRLSGGRTVWIEELDQEAYVEELDRLMDGFNSSEVNDVHLYWEEGALFVEYDPDSLGL